MLHCVFYRYSYLNILHGLIARYFDKGYLVGDTTSCFDLRSSFEHDNLLISILTVAFVILVLLFTFKSGGLPVLLILIIQGSIWCNFSVPTLRHSNLFFLTYLIISAIQMGANIDYAIVISDRYLESRRRLEPKEAITDALNKAFPTIVTSGTMMAAAGGVIAFVASNPRPLQRRYQRPYGNRHAYGDRGPGGDPHAGKGGAEP